MIVHGRLRIATWGEGDRGGTAIEIDADALGHSLRFGVARFERRSRAAVDSHGGVGRGGGNGSAGAAPGAADAPVGWGAMQPGSTPRAAPAGAGERESDAAAAAQQPTLVDVGAETPF